ncbi:hypothetical protein L2E82_27504 [Cichorium intybus]|uniref:Uncharacterized protein n=1 Tax=Cichorium intybus TaxID=13427 RepID=A0ACB9CTB8_CICIN|nr:hypothetical protein L2E82_27504 [Cichorium intybus]
MTDVGYPKVTICTTLDMLNVRLLIVGSHGRGAVMRFSPLLLPKCLVSSHCCWAGSWKMGCRWNKVEAIVLGYKRDTEQIPLDPVTNKIGDFWHVLLKGDFTDMLYGYKFYEEFCPEEGHYYDSSRILLDPYAKVGRSLMFWDMLMIVGAKWPGKDSPVQSLPVSGTCTESTSGTAFKMDPLLGGSNRKNNDKYALVSSMSSFSDRRLAGLQGKCALPNRELQISRLSGKVYKTRNDAVVGDNNVKNTLGVKRKYGKTRKRKRTTLNAVEHLNTEDSWSQPYRRGHSPPLLLAGDNTDPPPFSHFSVFWETRTPPETCIHRASNTTLVVAGLGCGLPEEQSLSRILSWQFDQQVVLRGESPLPSLNLSP